MFVEDQPKSLEERRALARRQAKDQPVGRSATGRLAVRAPASRFSRLLAHLGDSVLYGVTFVLGLVPVFVLVIAGVLDSHSVRAAADVHLELIRMMTTKNWHVIVVAEAAWTTLAAQYSVLFAFVFVQWRMIASRGQPVGKKLFGIQIVNSEGHSPGFFAGVVLRSGLWGALSTASVYVPSGIPVLLVTAMWLANVAAIFLEPPRCLHDYLAGTHVVDA